jgi:NTP-dependent ternary conflict system VMAP-like protein/SIR2-like protein
VVPEDLVAAVRNQTVVPFVGAGLSVSVGRGVFPDWRELIERFAERLERESLVADAAAVREHLRNKRFPEAAELAVEKLTPARFNPVLEQAFGIQPPRDVDLSAVAALWSLRPRSVITTNYDDVLSWPIKLRSSQPYAPARLPPRIVHNDDPDLLQRVAAPATDDPPIVWHLHGSVQRPSTIILTEKQYLRLYGNDPQRVGLYAFALDQLRSLVANRTLLFVGFSLDDPFIRAQLESIVKVTAQQNKVSYVLLRKSDKDVTAMLAQYRVQIVEFDDFGPPMVRAIGEIADAALGRAAVSVSVPRALVGLVDDLVALLRLAAPEPSIVGRAFNRWRPRRLPPFPLGGDGMALAVAGAEKLAGAMRQSSGYFPLLEFAREIGLRAPLATRNLFASWLEDAARSLAEDANDEARLVAGGFAAPDAAPGGDNYVLVRLDTAGADLWRGQAWLFSGSEPWKLFEDEQNWARGDLPTLVYDLLDRVAALELQPANTMIAFMVPRALLVEAIDLIEPAVEFAREPPIGATLPVTVRSLERLKFRANMRRLGTTWQALKPTIASAWALDDRLPTQTPGAAVWLNASDAGPDLAARLQQYGVTCAVLATPPASIAGAEGNDLFNYVLQAAVPAVVWLREPAAADMTTARARLADLLGGATGSLPQRVWQLRQAARTGADPTHPGLCLVLLWDDADRLPPDEDPANRAAVSRS